MERSPPRPEARFPRCLKKRTRDRSSTRTHAGNDARETQTHSSSGVERMLGWIKQSPSGLILAARTDRGSPSYTPAADRGRRPDGPDRKGEPSFNQLKRRATTPPGRCKPPPHPPEPASSLRASPRFELPSRNLTWLT